MLHSGMLSDAMRDECNTYQMSRMRSFGTGSYQTTPKDIIEVGLHTLFVTDINSNPQNEQQ